MRAVTRRLDGEVDLVEQAGDAGVVFERGRIGLAGRREAMRVPADAASVARALSAFDIDDEVGVPGCGPVAFAAIPFDPDAKAEAIIPAEIWGRAEDGTRWHTVVEGAQASSAAPDVARRAPTRFAVESALASSHYTDLVERATKAMADGSMRKVVLAREVVVSADAPIDVTDVLGRLRSTFPGCFVFHVDGFIGASPELLVARAGDVVRSHPMAGTAARGGDPTTDARLAASLLSSAKEREEHQITIDMVHDTLLAFSSYVDYEAEPSIVPVANVQHLATLVEGRLSHPPASVLELARALHPTPAVCGQPRDEALAFIRAEEGFDRGRYAGTVGWVDARGNGTWAVSVRVAELDGRTARLYAGCGIVPDSEPAVELAETRVKLQALLSALIRP
ncbi:MAG: isochorismate synthase [Acidimicrobiales bacterium]